MIVYTTTNNPMVEPNHGTNRSSGPNSLIEYDAPKQQCAMEGILN